MEFFKGNNRWHFRSKYSINLPKGLLTDILKDFCWSRMSVLGNYEISGQAGCPILQDDLNICLGAMTIMVAQRINEVKAQNKILKKQVEIITTHLLVPMTFEMAKEKEPSMIEEIIKLKKKLLSLKKGNCHEKER